MTLHVTLAAGATSGSIMSNTGTVATTGTTDPSTENNTSNTVTTTVQRQVETIYRLLLSRDDEAGGVADWTNALEYQSNDTV